MRRVAKIGPDEAARSPNSTCEMAQLKLLPMSPNTRNPCLPSVHLAEGGVERIGFLLLGPLSGGVFEDHGCGFFADHDGGGIGVAGDDCRHDRSIGDA